MKAESKKTLINRLTICIFTYNREQQLLKTLRRIQKQTNQNFDIYIADNHSSFDYTNVRDYLEENFKNRYRVFVRESNVGAINNYFLGICETTSEWVWVIADDDIPEINAVEKIYREIESNRDAACICATLANMPFDNHRIVVNTVKDFVSLYYPAYIFKANPWHGDLIWSSNKVYHTESVRKIICDIIPQYSNFQFPSTLLVILSLKMKLKVVYTDYRIIGYNDRGIEWNIQNTILSTLQINEIQFTHDKGVEKKVKRIVAFHISELYKLAFVIDKNKKETNDLLWKMYTGLYKDILPIHYKLQMFFAAKISQNRDGMRLIRKLVRCHIVIEDRKAHIKECLKRLLRQKNYKRVN